MHVRSFQLQIACVIIICMDSTLLKLDKKGLCDYLQLCMDLRLLKAPQSNNETEMQNSIFNPEPHLGMPSSSILSVFTNSVSE